MDGNVPFLGPSVEFSTVCKNERNGFVDKSEHDQFCLFVCFQVPSIEPKKILNYFNQFVSDSVQILNKFSSTCDAKLEILSFRLQDIEATLSILEAKVRHYHISLEYIFLVLLLHGLDLCSHSVLI